MPSPTPESSRRLYVLKPDEIGDFILTTGCLRTLATQLGEENLLLAVSKAAAPLARSQFPRATVHALEFRRRRKVLNVTLVNIGLNWRVWNQLRRTRVEWAICLRSLRSYLHTVLFYTPRARHYIACENLLGKQKRQRRPAVESAVKKIFHPTLLPYPAREPGSPLPTDLQANRLVTSAVLGRTLDLAETWPSLHFAAPNPLAQGAWVLAPFSSSVKKDYPLESWIRVFQALAPWRAGAPLRLSAAPYQQNQLQHWASTLQNAGIPDVSLLPPVPVEQYPAVLAGAARIFTVDTAAAHFACALRRPSLILSAGHHPGVYGPYSPDGNQLWIAPDRKLPENRWFEAVTPERILAEFSRAFGPLR